MAPYVVHFAELEHASSVGGKAANLARMARAGFPVPPGFCVTTAAFRAVVSSPELDAQIDALDQLDIDDAPSLRAAGQRLREHIVGLPIPADVEQAIVAAWSALGEQHGYAVRSSATAEDLPSASFAGQQDTYLNVHGRADLLEHVRRCWASLFTDRAISYRARNGFRHLDVQLAVVVQRMVLPDAAGVMFTADPLDGRRHIVRIDATFGLGEALVSGLVNPDGYAIDKRTQSIVALDIGDKRLAIVPIPISEGGGTLERELDDARRHAQVLTDTQITALARLGVELEQAFGEPLDIEWCIEGDRISLTQARPITTLFPIPQRPTPRPDPGLRVYISFGHVQVMTDTMAPFAHGVIRRFFPIARDARGISQIICAGGGRLYIDPTDLLRLPAFARRVPKVLRLVDAPASAAIAEVVARPEFRDAARVVSRARVLSKLLGFARRIVPRVLWRVFVARSAVLVERTRRDLDQQFAAFEARWRRVERPREQLRMCVDELLQLVYTVFIPVAPSVMAAGISGVLLRKLMGDRAAPDDLEALRRGLRGNVTTQMDLELGDLADLARAEPRVATYLRQTDHPSLDELATIDGAEALLDGLREFLDRYGMRGAAEIDVSRTRWRDDPRLLLQVLRGNLGHTQAGAHREQHESMIRDGDAALERIIAAAPPLRRPLVRRFATTHRNLAALREHPKFQMIRYFELIHRSALAYADELVAAGRLDDRTDVWRLEIDELLAAEPIDLRARVAERRSAWQHYARLSPPRVITSDGEIVRARADNHDAPVGALIGTGVSAGVVEGRARVVRDPSTAALHAGEILVAPFTDPGWTPLFINAAGLVMEAGGMMTHGSVVAREYGIPAVVAVDGATTRIRTGQWLIVDGTRGFVSVRDD